MARVLKSFYDVWANYEDFIFDIWGVVHNEQGRLPGVLETLKFLKFQNKRIFFLSNMPHPAADVQSHLQHFGITSVDYDGVYASGQGALDYARTLKKEGKIRLFHWGRVGSMERHFVERGMQFVSYPELADMILMTHEDYGANPEGERSLLKTAYEHQIPLLCTNPDYCFGARDTAEIMAGSLAYQYQQMGGSVLFIGKPFPYIYLTLCDRFHIPHNGDRKPPVLAIGDTLETDIRGAQHMDWDTLLVLTGESARTWSSRHSIQPNYVLQSFH